MSDKLNKCVFVLVIVFIIALILLTSITPSMNANSKNKQIVYNLTDDEKTNKIDHKTEADDSKRFPHYFNFSADTINNNKSDYSDDNPINSSNRIEYDKQLIPIIENNNTMERSLGKPIVGSNLISDTVIGGKQQNYAMNHQMSQLIPVYSEGIKLVSDILRSGPWSDTENDDKSNLTQITSQPTHHFDVDLDVNVTKSNLSIIPFSFRALLNKKPMSLPLMETKSNNKRNIVSIIPKIKEKIFDDSDSENGNYVKPELTVTRQSLKSQISPIYYNKHYTTKHSYNKNFYTANKYSNPTAKYYKNFSERSDYFSDGDESFAPKPLLSVKEYEEYASVEKTPQTKQILRSENQENDGIERQVNNRPVEDLKRTYISKVRRIQEENSRLKNLNNEKFRLQEYSPHLYRNSRHYSTSNPRRISGDNHNNGNEFRTRIHEDYQTTTTTAYNNDDETDKPRTSAQQYGRIRRPEYDDYNANTNNRPQVYRSVYTRPIGHSLIYKPDMYETASTKPYDEPFPQTHQYDDNDYESEKVDENRFTEEPEEPEHPKQLHSTSTPKTVNDYPPKPKPYIQFTPYKPFEPFRPSLFPYKRNQRQPPSYHVIVERPRNLVHNTVLHASPSNIPPEIKTSSKLHTDHNAANRWTTIRPPKQYTTTPKPNVINNRIKKNKSIISLPTMTTVTNNQQINQQMNRLLNERVRQLFSPRTEVLSEYHTLLIPIRITYPANITTNAERMAVERILSRL